MGCFIAEIGRFMGEHEGNWKLTSELHWPIVMSGYEEEETVVIDFMSLPSHESSIIVYHNVADSDIKVLFNGRVPWDKELETIKNILRQTFFW